MKPISKVKLGELLAAQSELDQLTNAFGQRTEYIVRTMASLFKKKISWWDFENERDNDRGGFFDVRKYSESVSIDGERGDGEFFSVHFDSEAILNDGKVWLLNTSFPTRWLFEDFETELIKGIKKFKVENEKKKKKELIQRKKKKAEVNLYHKAITKVAGLPVKKLKELGLV